MVRIEKTVEVHASRDAIWRIISDLESEPDYWYGTKEARFISKTTDGSTVRREITQNFRNHKILQEVKLDPPNSVKVLYLKGLTQGKKVMAIEEIGPRVQRLRVTWDVKFTGIYFLATPILTRHTARGTENALRRIKDAAEASLQKPVGN